MCGLITTLETTCERGINDVANEALSIESTRIQATLEQRACVRLLGVAVVAMVAACTDPVSPSAPAQPPDARPWVISSVLRHLDQNGHFVFATPTDEPCISRRYAVDLANAYVRTVLQSEGAAASPGGRDFREALESLYGKPIFWQSLAANERWTYYGTSPYISSPDYPDFGARRIAPRYLVPLEIDGDLIATLAVSCRSEQVQISDAGRLVFPIIFGGEFQLGGVPHNIPDRVPLWPEQAVQIVAQQTGAKIAAPPRFLLPDVKLAARLGKWELKLDRAIEVVIMGSGARVSTTTIYIGVSDKRETVWFIADADQPTSDLIDLAPDDPTLVSVPFRNDVPTRFTRIESGAQS